MALENGDFGIVKYGITASHEDGSRNRTPHLHKSNPLVSVGLSLLLLTPGCSIYKAATAPSPVDTNSLQPGMPRSHVMSVLGYPKSTEVVNGERTEMYEYVNGSEGASKVRILLYAAGDLFTLCLTELIFWPAELAFGQGTDERAVAIYGQDDKARQIRITKKDGTVIADRQKPGIAEPAAIGTIGQSARTDQNLSESDFKRLVQQLFVGLADQKFLRLAVLPTEHISGSGSKTFSNYMTEKLTYGIYEAKVGKLVERARLIKVMEELQLSHEARFEERTAKRIGLMSGADIVVISSFVEIGSKIVEVNAKAVSVETGEIVGVGTMKFPAEIISKLMY
jgi:hypothetical protein